MTRGGLNRPWSGEHRVRRLAGLTRRQWFWASAYLCVLLVVMALITLGVAQRCPVFEQGYFGCGDMSTSAPAWSYLFYFLVGASIVTAAGVGLTFALRRRPTRHSLIVWISVGVLGFGFVSNFFVSRPLATPLAVAIAVAAVTATRAGVSLARPRKATPDRAGG